MQLKSLVVKNFRALEDIQVEFESRVNVIVGPNAVGKTTVLEAIRLAKALLAPRTQNESNQALFALGAAAPHNPQEFNFAAIARDEAQSVQIRCRYDLAPSELDAIEASMQQIVTSSVLAAMGQGFANPASTIGMLSSPQGVTALTQTDQQFRDFLQSVRANRQICRLDLLIDPSIGRMQSGDPLGAAFIGFLDRQHSPYLTTFSYFPADRALPPGEQPVQLGAADASLQMESHFSQPQIKYTRLKNMIFNTVVRGPKDREELAEEFARIFDGILKGRKLSGVGVNKQGLLSLRVLDTETGRTFEIDGMSSGEKGLILTFLLIGRTLADGGIILLDEPELHLNPAVCKDLLSFLVKNYVVRKNLQAIVCSHSPEILAGAFDNDQCSLYHLVSEKILTKVRYKDEEEISEALSKLGTSESEGLLYKATIFVEGDDDVDLLGAGFGDMLRRYKIKDLGGRREIEKQIERLQAAEQKGSKLSPRYFIFDRDELPTGLKDSETVKVLQWDRHCVENYLIDIDVLTDLLKDPEVMRKPLSNQAEISKLFRELAMSQIDEFAARQVYSSYELESPGLRVTEIRGEPLSAIADILFARLSKIKAQTEQLDPTTWKQNFVQSCESAREQLTPVWELKWVELCDGKRLFQELFQRAQFGLSLPKFKKRVMQEMRIRPSQGWLSIESLLKRLIGK